jgi:hypothetical protein
MFSRTSSENHWAIQELESKERCLQTPDGQTDARNAVRILFSAIEARTFMALRMLNAAMKLGDITWSAGDAATIARSQPIEERYVGALTLWSRFLGHDRCPPTSGELWDAFRSARDFRDRITHPKSVAAFRFTEAEFDLLMATLAYFRESTDALTVDPDKWTTLPSNRSRAKEGAGSSEERERTAIPPQTVAKVGRNDPCPCGSGKKYKKCHGSVAGQTTA